MPTNDIQLLAEGGDANVLSQAEYLALTGFLDAGFVAGIVPSAQMNKVLRQATLMAYVLAQFIVNQTGLPVLDNGAPAAILSNMATAIQNTTLKSYPGNPNGHVAGVAAIAGAVPVAPSVVWDTSNQIFWVCATAGTTSTAIWVSAGSSQGSIYCGTSTGAANAQILSPVIPLPAYGAGVALAFVAGFTNTGALTVNVSGLGVRNVLKDSPTGPIPLTGGEVVAGNMISMRDDGAQFQLTATELGTAALANASSNTGIVAAVSGNPTIGNLAAFNDATGTLVDSGLTSLSSNPATTLYQLGYLM